MVWQETHEIGYGIQSRQGHQCRIFVGNLLPAGKVTHQMKVFHLAQQLEHADPAIYTEVCAFVKDWYISHVLGTDRENVDFLIAKGAK